MNPPQFFAGYGAGDGGDNSSRPSPRKELQGPRPPSLKVNKDSYKIRKPPVVPHHHHQAPPPSLAPSLASDDRQPVIIYAVSPKVIHTTVSDFMNLVQRLTGNTTDGAATSAGDLSPAARLASVEKTSPKTAEISINSENDVMGDLLRDVEVGGRFSGILSPAPGSLPPISPGFFSPASCDPFMMGFNNMFIPSPSTLFSAPMVSPSTSSSSDFLFNSFFDL